MKNSVTAPKSAWQQAQAATREAGHTHAEYLLQLARLSIRALRQDGICAGRAVPGTGGLWSCWWQPVCESQGRPKTRSRSSKSLACTSATPKRDPGLLAVLREAPTPSAAARSSKSHRGHWLSSAEQDALGLLTGWPMSVLPLSSSRVMCD